MAKSRRRILKSEPILSPLLKEEDSFYVGISLHDYKSSKALSKYKLNENPKDNEELLPAKAGPISKINLEGKWERVKPERKHIINKHIEYTRKDGIHVSFDRDFNVYVKELSSQYKIKLKLIKNEYEQFFIVSPKLTFTKDEITLKKITLIINLFLEIFQSYEIFTSKIEPALAFHKKFDFEILPSGQFNEEDVETIIEGARRFTKDEKELKAIKERLDYIREFKPKLAGSGTKGFYGYVAFEFPDYQLAVVESMYIDNATYVFDLNGYEELIKKDKQELINNKLFKKRIKHNDVWKQKIKLLFK